MTRTSDIGGLPKNRQSEGMTPFRYPGGKAFLAGLLQERIEATGGAVTTYAEPYAGGAGAAVELLARGVVERIILNDFDRRIYSVWWAIINETDKFIERIQSTSVTLDTWYSAREIVENNAKDEDPFELGFSTFFLNRTNHSGVIIGAGPIGGYKQTGKWLINARWYPDTISKRVRWLGEHRDQIDLSNNDGLSFLNSFDATESASIFFFVDPPYVQAGAKLYMNAMNDLKHRDLAAYLTGPMAPPHWLVTYDDCQLIGDVYANASIERLPVRYSLRRKRMEHEVCVIPAHATAARPLL